MTDIETNLLREEAHRLFPGEDVISRIKRVNFLLSHDKELDRLLNEYYDTKKCSKQRTNLAKMIADRWEDYEMTYYCDLWKECIAESES
jgi:hypothetical protein